MMYFVLVIRVLFRDNNEERQQEYSYNCEMNVHEKIRNQNMIGGSRSSAI